MTSIFDLQRSIQIKSWAVKLEENYKSQPLWWTAVKPGVKLRRRLSSVGVSQLTKTFIALELLN